MLFKSLTDVGQRHISLLLADQIIDILQDSGASEAEKYSALDVARAVVPVLVNACSVEANDLFAGGNDIGSSN